MCLTNMTLKRFCICRERVHWRKNNTREIAEKKANKKKTSKKKKIFANFSFLLLLAYFFSFLLMMKEIQLLPTTHIDNFALAVGVGTFPPEALRRMDSGWRKIENYCIARDVIQSRQFSLSLINLSLSLFFLFSLSAQLSLFHSLFPALLLNKWTKQKKKF